MATAFEKVESLKPDDEKNVRGLNLVDIAGDAGLKGYASLGTGADTSSAHVPKLDLTGFSPEPSKNATKTAAETFPLSDSVTATRYQTNQGPAVVLKDTSGNQLGIVYKGKFVLPPPKV